jgi:hypothetical protein
MLTRYPCIAEAAYDTSPAAVVIVPSSVCFPTSGSESMPPIVLGNCERGEGESGWEEGVS